ncbi:MAG: hypothetical protein LBP51_03335 [Deferribacteraceae bacterium]|nr:hypothetical protein [Deferribacteraceae bacterium]
MKKATLILFLCFFGFTISVNAAGKTPFEGSWENTKNETVRYKFSGSAYEAYWELEGENGEHYYKGRFSYRELSPGAGAIEFEQTHSAVTEGAWKQDEDDEMTNYRFLNSNTLEINSMKYEKQ